MMKPNGYIVYKQGVWVKEIIGVYQHIKLALEIAKRVAKQEEKDDYHDIVVACFWFNRGDGISILASMKHSQWKYISINEIQDP